MAINQNQIVDYLYKKLGFGVSKTDYPSAKSPSNETIPSPLLIPGTDIWQLSDEITAINIAPTSNSSVVTAYNDALGSTVTCVPDSTTLTRNETWLTGLTDWIPTEFGSGYQVLAYAAPAGTKNPQTKGVWLPPQGTGNNDAWFFDYQSGVLNFADTNIPTAVTGNVVYVTGARYTGQKGIKNFPEGLTLGSLEVTGSSKFDGPVTIAHLNVESVNGAPSGAGIFYGDTLTGSGAIYGGLRDYTWRPNTTLGLTGNINGLSQLNFQNVNSGSAAAGGLVIYANNGNTANTYVVLGMASSGYATQGQIYANDAFLTVLGNTQTGGGNLILGTTANNNVMITTGAGLNSAFVNGVGLKIYTNVDAISTTTGALQVVGGAGITGNIYSGGNITSAGNVTVGRDATVSGTLYLKNPLPGSGAGSGGGGGSLDMTGSLSVGGNINSKGSAVISGGLTVSGAIDSVSTSTGTIVVTGGIGASGNVNAGGNVTARGDFVTLGQANIFGNINANSSISVTNSLTVGSEIHAQGAVTGSSFSGVTVTGNIQTDAITSVHGDITLTPGSSGVAAIVADTALGIPAGTAEQRPANPEPGYLRYNVDSGSIEWWTGSIWSSATSLITNQSILGDGTTDTFTLDQAATSVGMLVTINGTTQQPDVAYTVSGDEITFTEAPLPTDNIDVRFLATAGLTANVDVSVTYVNGGMITMGQGSAIIDSFNVQDYRSAKYSVSSATDWDSQLAEVLLTQNLGQVAVSALGVVNTGANTVSFSANIQNNTVTVWATATANLNKLRIQRTYFNL
jgi:cytoskeletal protein CcmA (bactofilin family)